MEYILYTFPYCFYANFFYYYYLLSEIRTQKILQLQYKEFINWDGIFNNSRNFFHEGIR